MGGKSLREPGQVSKESKIFLSWENRMRWLEAETGQRAEKEVSKSSGYSFKMKVKIIEDH